jgi:hypothetical protein
MKRVNLTINVPSVPTLIGLIAAIVLTLFSSVFTTSAATLNQPPAASQQVVSGDTITGCVGNSSPPSDQSLTLAGRVITPSTLLRLDPSGICPGETKVTWNVQGPQGEVGPQGPKGDPTYTHTIVVSPIGNDATNDAANGVALLSAMITISNTAPTLHNSYLLKLEPGVYDLGYNSLNLVPFVDLEGSGEAITMIISRVNSVGSLTSGTLNMTTNSEARLLTIVNTGEANYSSAVYVRYVNFNGGWEARLTHVTAYILAGEGTENYGIYTAANTDVKILNSTIWTPSNNALVTNYGIDNNGILTVQNSDISAAGGDSSYAIRNNSGGELKVQNSTFSATRGASLNVALVNTGNASLTIENSNLSATTTKSSNNTAILNSNSSAVVTVQNSTLLASIENNLNGTANAIYNQGTLKVGASEVSGGVVSSGTLKCVASYDADFNPIGSECII